MLDFYIDSLIVVGIFISLHQVNNLFVPNYNSSLKNGI